MNMLRLAFLLFVAVFLTQGAVTASSDLPSNVWASLTQLHNFVQNTITHTGLPSTLRADFPVGCDAESGVNSTDCDTAKKDFQDAVSTCRVAYLANGFLDPLSVNTSDINTFCFEGCNNRVYAQVAQVARSCWSNTTGFNASSVENFEAALAVITATCLFVGDNEVCFNQLQNITRVADSIKNGSLTEDQLEELCFYPCVDGQYRALKSVSQGRYLGVVGFYKQFCSNIDDEWCAVEYQDAVAQEQKAPTKTKTTKAVCSPCNRRFVQSASKNLKLAGGSVGSFSSADFDAKVDALTYRCDADRHGKFCTEIVDKKAKKPVDISACQGLFDATLPTSCSSECATQLRAQIEATECCTLTDYKRRLNASLANGSNPQVGEVYDYIRNQCNVSLANTCSKQVITFSLGLSNVNDDWINNSDNKAAFSQALRQDLAAQFGVPLDNVVVSSVEFVPAANGSLEVACIDGVRVVRSGIRVTGYIVPPSGQGASILYTEFSNAVQDDLLELGQTATVLPLNYDGRTDVLSPFERNFRIGSEVGLASNPNGPQ